MKPLLFILCFSLFGTISAQTDSPVGRWKTIDDESGEARSIIEIYREGNVYFGKISEILTGNDDAICTECEGEREGKPILGMVIIEDLSVDNDEPGEWDGGKILDPQSGSDYRLSVWYEDGNGEELYVRGKHWTGLYRTQKWIRE
ncbi:DUF2147 domain-containing protein [Neolewinella xylanilytica]|nr:DUF2147 domain-containing protein [Neolewinella xylanilytica]